MRYGGNDELVSIQTLETGTRVALAGDIEAEVVDNPRDGMWLIVRYLTTPAGPVTVERIELTAADEVLGVIG